MQHLRFISLAVACAFAVPCSADLIRLKSGAEFRGQIQRSQDDARNGTITIQTLTGAVVRLSRKDVEITARRSLLIEEYETRARKEPDTVAAHWALAEWCRERSLKRQQSVHLERIVLLDPSHTAAREALGHRRVDGRWLTEDQYMTELGYVKYKGRYITEEEFALLEEASAESEAEREWFRQIRLWKNWLSGRNPQKSEEALAGLKGIDDPTAIRGLVKNFADEEDLPLRHLMVSILAELDSPKTIGPLVRQSLHDVDHELRYFSLNAIRPSFYEAAAELYLLSLKDDQNGIVNRAAQALARVGNETSVPALIDALITKHEYRVRVPDRSSTYSFGADASSGVQPGQLPGNLTRQIAGGQFPNGVIIRQPDEPIRWRTVLIVKQHQNADVLTALQKLTTKDFGYDKRTWRLWLTARQNGLD